MLPAVDPPAVPFASPEQHEYKEENPGDEVAEDEGREMKGELSSSRKGEKRTESQEAVPVERRVTMQTASAQRTANFKDKLVKRRVTGKTDTNAERICSLA